jgi:hypothetical protein
VCRPSGAGLPAAHAVREDPQDVQPRRGAATRTKKVADNVRGWFRPGIDRMSGRRVSAARSPGSMLR